MYLDKCSAHAKVDTNTNTSNFLHFLAKSNILNPPLTLQLIIIFNGLKKSVIAP